MDEIRLIENQPANSEDLCVSPARLHAIGRVVLGLPVHAEPEEVRLRPPRRARRRSAFRRRRRTRPRSTRPDAAEHVEPEPPVVEVAVDDPGGVVVVREPAVVDVQHQCRRVLHIWGKLARYLVGVLAC